MKKLLTNSIHQFLNLILVFSFSTLICSTIFGQSNASVEKLSANNLNILSVKSGNSAADRPRIVVKNDSDNKESKLLSQFEHQAFDILNQKRIQNGLSMLRWSEDMARIARSHSQDMAQYKYFSHSGRNGAMVNDRADSLGFSNWQAIGENIAFNRGYDKPVEFACEGWMKSPAHRDNILSARWKEAGIGVALASDGSYYFTEVFIMR